MADIPLIARCIAAEEALRNQLTHLVDVITQMVLLAESLPEGDLRHELFDRISDLDSIADVMRQALDSRVFSARLQRAQIASIPVNFPPNNNRASLRHQPETAGMLCC